jgi:hypothetical protein
MNVGVNHRIRPLALVSGTSICVVDGDDDDNVTRMWHCAALFSLAFVRLGTKEAGVGRVMSGGQAVAVGNEW